MAIVTLTVESGGRKLPFCFPDSGNMQYQIHRIFSGQDYPLPPLPENYRFGTIVDVGANVGAAAIWFLDIAPQARLVCFEPENQNFECLTQNLHAFPNAEAHHCGLFSMDREVKLYLGFNQCMQHSIFASCETGSATETISLRRAGAEFDRLGIGRISILKIDTEGCEVAILEDLADRLAQIDMIHLEWHSDDDRRRIDSMLAERFLLAYANAQAPHRGNACYLAREVAAKVPKVEAMRIGEPTQ